MNDRILRITDLEDLLGVSRSSLYAWMKTGVFPRPFNLGPRAVGWKASDIEAWVEKRKS